MPRSWRRGERNGGERGGLIASTRFPYAKQLYGGRHEISGPLHYRGARGPHRVEFPALIRHYAIFKSGPRGIFRSNELLPPFSSTPPSRPLDAFYACDTEAALSIDGEKDCGVSCNTCQALDILLRRSYYSEILYPSTATFRDRPLLKGAP